MNSDPKTLFAQLQNLLGNKHVCVPTVEQTTDRRGHISAPALAIVYPENTQQVSSLLAYCNTHKISVVPQGGNTGNVAGAVPTVVSKNPVILINLKAMNTIETIDPLGNTVTVQAGAILSDIQAYCQNHKRTFPIDLAPNKQVHIGGLLATNAGGLNVIGYGMTRDNVLGLEVVLPDGTVLSDMVGLQKNSMGIDIKNLFIGSEGTLGIITRAILKIHPETYSCHGGIFSCDDINSALDILHAIRRDGGRVTTFEIWDSNTHRYGMHYEPTSVFDHLKTGAWYGYIEITNSPQSNHPSVTWLSNIDSQHAFEFRGRHSYALGAQGHINHDIAVPLKHWQDFIVDVNDAVKNIIKNTGNTDLIPAHFGHLGDGNLHLEFVRPDDMDMQSFRALTPSVNNTVYDRVKQYGGTPASEHGIGQVKKDLMHSHLRPDDYEFMKSIKDMIDPNNIMNTGKIF